MRISLPAAAVLAGFLSVAMVPVQASANMIAFTDWKSTEGLIDPIFTVDDMASPGSFSVNIDIASGLGKLTGIFFDLSNQVEKTDISSLTDGSGDPIEISSFGNDVTNVGGGVNLRGLVKRKDDFDVGFSIPQSDVPVSFLVSDLAGALSLDDWTRVGLRFQTVGANGEESDKLLSATVSKVPLPAALPLLLTALAGLGLLARRRRRSPDLVPA